MIDDLLLTERPVAGRNRVVIESAKKTYYTPSMEIEYFDVADIITTSKQEVVIDEKVESGDDDGFEGNN